MTTPPLDLTQNDLDTIRLIADGGSRNDVMTIKNTSVLALLSRVEAGESARDHWEEVARGALGRAEAAEAKVAAVRARHRPVSVMEAWGTHGRDLDGAMACAVCTSPDDAGVTLHPCPELIALDGTP